MYVCDWGKVKEKMQNKSVYVAVKPLQMESYWL
jgi:hypothetical protein